MPKLFLLLSKLIDSKLLWFILNERKYVSNYWNEEKPNTFRRAV
jgi:hypothetical protein